MRCKLCIECIYHIYKTVPTSELGYWLRHLASGLRPSQSDSVESDRKLTLNLFETYFRWLPHAYQMYVKCLARVLLGTLKVQKPLKNQWFLMILSMSALAGYERWATDDECKRSAEEAVAHKSSDLPPGQIYLRCMWKVYQMYMGCSVSTASMTIC